MNKIITGNGISQESLVNYFNRVLNLGLDVHCRQVTVAMQEDGGRIKSAGKIRHVDFLNWVQKKPQEGYLNRVLNLGLDVHYRQVTVAMPGGGGRVKTPRKKRARGFL